MKLRNFQIFSVFMFDSLFSSGMTSATWWVVGGAHIQAFTFSTQGHGRLLVEHISKPFALLARTLS